MIKSEMDQTERRNGFEMNTKIFGEKVCKLFFRTIVSLKLEVSLSKKIHNSLYKYYYFLDVQENSRSRNMIFPGIIQIH